MTSFLLVLLALLLLFLFLQRRDCLLGRLQLQESLIEKAELKSALEHQKFHFESQIEWIKKNEEALEARFSLASQKTLDMAQKSLLEMSEGKWRSAQELQDKTMDLRHEKIESLVAPIRESLDKLEKERQGEQRQWSEVYGGMKEALQQQLNATRSLEKEALHLVQTFKTPHLRGAWGELQLQRLVELSGMTSYCDFETQKSLPFGECEKRLRPDMVIHLPQKRKLAVDAKAPLKAFLESFDLLDEKERNLKLQEHLVQLRLHVQKLSQKEYWSQLPGLDLVVMFIPSDTFLHHALNLDATLFEWAVEKQVLLATPSSLIAILKVCSQNWHRALVEEKVEEVLENGKELYSRLLKMAEHLGHLGKAIDKAATCYNQTVSCWQSRVLSSAKKLAELNPAAEDPERLEPLHLSLKKVETPSQDDV